MVEAANVIWCTGFQQVFDWIKLPIFDGRGWPVEYRGVVEGAPGLYFCGLSFQYAFSSMICRVSDGTPRSSPTEITARRRSRATTAALTARRQTGRTIVKIEWCPMGGDGRPGPGAGGVRAPGVGQRRMRLCRAARPPTLTAQDFARLATQPCWWVGGMTACKRCSGPIRLSHDTGQRANAARCAFWLAMVLIEIGEDAVSSGWIARAERLLNETPGEIVEHGYVVLPPAPRGSRASTTRPAWRADEVVAYGARFAEPDLTALGLSVQGLLQIYAGQVGEGKALLDEAMIEVSAGGDEHAGGR